MTDLESACINSEIGWIKITASENGIRKFFQGLSSTENQLLVVNGNVDKIRGKLLKNDDMPKKNSNHDNKINYT